MSLAKRIIPCLDVRDGRTVKGVHFQGLRDVGDAVELGARYAAEGADELVYLDISATLEGRRTFTALVQSIARHIDIPFTVGGGISTVADAERLLSAGADKVSINSAALACPDLIDELASRFGSQFVVVAIDAKQVKDNENENENENDSDNDSDSDSDNVSAGAELDRDDDRRVWRCATHGGHQLTNRTLFEWAHEVQERGAGEILFTSMDHDGTRNGYPCDTYARLTSLLSIPVIASGGAGTIGHIADVLTAGQADAALVAGILHDGVITLPDIKRGLRQRGINIRI